MITSFEVGAIFDIEDRASGTIASLAERVRGLTADIAAAKEGLATLGSGDILSGVTKGFTSLRDAIFNTKTATDSLGAAFTEMGASAARGSTAATEAVNGIGTAVTRVTEQVQALRTEMSRPFEIAMAGGGGGLMRGGTGMGRGGYGDYDDVPGQGRIGGGGDGSVYAEYEAIERQRLLGYGGGIGGGVGRGGSGSNGGPGLGGNYGGSGLTVPGGGGVGGRPPGGGIPLNYQPPAAPGAPHFGIGEMIEAGAIYDAVHSSMDEGLAIRRTELALGLPTEGPDELSSADTLRSIARSSSAGQNSIYTERQTAAAMPVLARELGFKGQEGLQRFGAIFPTALKSAEVAEMEGLGSMHETLAANVEYAHLTGNYDQDGLTTSLNRLQAIAAASNQSPAAEEKILKYSVPIGMAAGMGADQTAMLTGFLQQMGFNSSTAGTGLSRMILSVLDTGGGLSGHLEHTRRRTENSLAGALSLRPEQIHSQHSSPRESKHVAALHAMGVLDAHGHLTVTDDHGGLDPMKLLSRIHDYGTSHTPLQTLGTLHDAMGVQGERVGSPIAAKDTMERLNRYYDNILHTPTSDQQQAALANTPMQHFEQLVARTSDLFNTLATSTLPAVDKAFTGLTQVVSSANTHLQGHPDESIGAGIGIGSIVGGQLLNAGRWVAGQAAARGFPGAAGIGRLLGIGADIAPVGAAIGGGIAIGGALDDAIGWGVDGIFGKGAYERYNKRESDLLHQGFGGIFGSSANGTTQHTSAIDLINRAHPGMVPTSLPAAGGAPAPSTTNSNNTSTFNVGGISVTVNAAPGTEGQAAGQSVASALVAHLRSFLTHGGGAGEGMTSAAPSVGGHP